MYKRQPIGLLLYGVEIWADALRVRKYKRGMSAVQQSVALTMACSYRTVSESSVLVIAGIIPTDQLAQERKHNIKKA